MEIKIECACGEKYKFDLDPAYHRMPSPVSCPSCGADGTAQANDILLQSRTDAPPAVAPAPRIAPPPGVVAVPAAPVAPEASGGLRISHADTPPPPPPVFAPPVRRMVIEPAAVKPKSNAVLITIVVLLVVFGLIGAGVLVLGRRVYQKFAAIAEEVKTMSNTSGAGSESDTKHNFSYDDAVVLFIQHTNHQDVAAACQSFWKEKLHKNLAVIATEQDELAKGEYELWPAHNGWVRIMGTLEWPQGEYEGLAQELSRKFGGLVFEMRDVDFSGAYHFGAYEAGTRKFHAQMDIKIKNDDIEEIVTTEGNDWAIAHGYKPGPEGFKEFHLGDADEITQKLGMKCWDENPDATPDGKSHFVILREQGAGKVPVR